MYTIGEFSRITGLTVKTLRFYHEEEILIPSFIDPQTGYRYYADQQLELARIIAHLRAMEFPLNEIKDLLRSGPTDDELLDALQRQQSALELKIRHFRKVLRSLQQFISAERQAQAMSQTAFEIQEKTLEPLLIAAIRMKARYSDCGRGFAKIGRAFGRFINGPAMLLHYDSEYKEADADYEAAMPVKQSKTVDGISVRQLPGGRCVSLLHKGPYDQLGHSYAQILKYMRDKNYPITLPTREVYLKGPGMIFKGNPKNYLTEIQMLITVQ